MTVILSEKSTLISDGMRRTNTNNEPRQSHQAQEGAPL